MMQCLRIDPDTLFDLGMKEFKGIKESYFLDSFFDS
jgi:hypothetical protein